MSEEGDFAADPAAQRLHDLRQPLAAILAAATALRMRPDLPDGDRESLVEVIIRNAERLGEMLDEPGAS